MTVEQLQKQPHPGAHHQSPGIGRIHTEGDLKRWLRLQLQDPEMGRALASGLGFSDTAIRTKAGAISDADFAHTPPDGTLGGDVTNDRLYFRTGGTWKYKTIDNT